MALPFQIDTRFEIEAHSVYGPASSLSGEQNLPVNCYGMMNANGWKQDRIKVRLCLARKFFVNGK
jgi:hypothetical protein